MITDSFEVAYILHRRTYRESSLLIDFFSMKSGRFTAIARGAQRPKSPLRACLQLFQPLMISYYGHGEIVTLKQAEIQETFPPIAPHRLAWGFYINELLFRLIERYETYPLIFEEYDQLIKKMAHHMIEEIDLRYFEKKLLDELGYGLQLTHDIEQNTLIKADNYYQFNLQQGPSKTALFKENSNTFLGQYLLDLHYQTIGSDDSLLAAKRLLRMAIQQLLDKRPLKSRELII